MKIMKYYFPALMLSLTLGSVQAATTVLLSTNFDSMADGAASDATLNAATDGGTWELNTGRANTSYTIENSSGDKALLLDDDGSGFTKGERGFGTISLSNAASFATDSVAWNFKTAASRLGGGKYLNYNFLSGESTVAQVRWYLGGTVELNVDGDTDSTINQSAEWVGVWDPNADGVFDLTMTFSESPWELVPGSAVTLEFAGQTSGPLPLEGVTSIDGLQIESGGSSNGAKGLYLDNMTVRQIPEPSSLVLLGLGGLSLIIRRRK